MQKMSTCKILSKLTLFLLSALLWLISTLLSYIVLTILFAYKSYHSTIIVNYTTTPLILILSISVFMFVVGLFGIFALFTDNRYLLITYMICLTALLSVEVVAFTLSYVYKIEIDNYLDHTLENTVQNIYGHTNQTRFTHPYDYIQFRFKCCGQKNYTDWHSSYWYTHRTDAEQTNNTQVPQSCCANYEYEYTDKTTVKIFCTATSPAPTAADSFYTDGCYLKVKQLVFKHYSLLVAAVISFLVIHLLSLVSVSILINYKLKLLRKSIHPPYVNIEAEYEDEYTNQAVHS